MTTWVEVDGVFHGPPKPWCCVDGIDSHNWTASIEEGSIVLSSGCTLCDDGMSELEPEDFEMESIPVSVTIHHDPGNPPYGVDPYFYVEITPS